MDEDIYEDNVPGQFYVNTECIACDTCHDIAPNHFKLVDDYDHAIVSCQPKSDAEISLCGEALTLCPVAAIGKRL